MVADLSPPPSFSVAAHRFVLLPSTSRRLLSPASPSIIARAPASCTGYQLIYTLFSFFFFFSSSSTSVIHDPPALENIDRFERI